MQEDLGTMKLNDWKERQPVEKGMKNKSYYEEIGEDGFEWGNH